MKRPAPALVVTAAASLALGLTWAGIHIASRQGLEPALDRDELPCGIGFFRRGMRCCPTPAPFSSGSEGMCAVGPIRDGVRCPSSLVATPRGCDARVHDVVRVGPSSVLMGPSDWEAEGRVQARTAHTRPFFIDRFEVTVGRFQDVSGPDSGARFSGLDPARAVSHVTLAEARSACKARGGRLPTEDEWIVAAAGETARRYPWGETGAVCRRAVWGLVRGPCGTGAGGPDSVGAHPDGATPEGIHDLAGNVGEWVDSSETADAARVAPGDAAPSFVGLSGCTVSSPCMGIVRGGSYASELATELRTWTHREQRTDTRNADVGFRCAYDAP